MGTGRRATRGSPPEPAATGEAILRSIDGRGLHALPASGTFAIGRDEENDLTLDDPAVSRFHARVSAIDSGYAVEDLQSANGTFVEREQELLTAAEPVSLRPGDVVRLATFRLVFDDGSGARVDPQEGQPWSTEIHVPTIAAGFSHFFAGFLIWALPAVLAADMAQDLGLSGSTTALLPATAVLVGAVARLIFGLLTDARGPLWSGTLALGIGPVPLILLAFLGTHQAVAWPAVGLLGIGLAAVSVSMPMTSHRTAPARRGFALGIVSAGSVGIVVAGIAGPLLADAFDWQMVFAFALLPSILALGVFVYGARGSWAPAPRGEWRRLMRRTETQAVALFFGITFGGFAGLYTFLPTLLRREEFGLSSFEAALVVALGALAGGVMRIVGGLLADRFGPLRVLPYAIAGATALLVVAGSAQLGVALVMFVVTMALFDMGTAAVFKLAAQRFGAAVGAGIGFMSAAGGLAGFVVTLVLTSVLDSTGSAAAAFAILAAAPAAVAAWLFLAPRLQPRVEPSVTLPSGPYLQHLDSYGRPIATREIGLNLSIGRAPRNQLVLAEDDLVSRRHADVVTSEGRLRIRDLASTNGTMLWRDKQWLAVSDEELQDQDVIVIGATVLRYSTGDPVS